MTYDSAVSASWGRLEVLAGHAGHQGERRPQLSVAYSGAGSHHGGSVDEELVDELGPLGGRGQQI